MHVYRRYGSLDVFEVFVNGNKQFNTNAYVSFAKYMDMFDAYLFIQATDGLENDLFYTRNNIYLLPGPADVWYNYVDGNRTKVLDSGFIEVLSELRWNHKLDWDASLGFNYGDHTYNITIEDYSSYDAKERFVTTGYGRYGSDQHSWYAHILPYNTTYNIHIYALYV